MAEAGIDEPAEERAADNRTDVEKAGGHRWRRKNIPRIQHPHYQRRQRDEQDERIHDLREHNRGRCVLRRKAGREHADQLLCKDDSKQAHKAHEHRRKGHHFRGQHPGGGLALLLDSLGKNSDECRRERPLGKQIAQEIRRAKRDQEKSHRGRAEKGIEQNFAHQPEHAAAHHGDGDDPAGLRIEFLAVAHRADALRRRSMMAAPSPVSGRGSAMIPSSPASSSRRIAA